MPEIRLSKNDLSNYFSCYDSTIWAKRKPTHWIHKKKKSTEGIRTFNTLFQPWQAFNLPRESSAAIRNEHNFIKQRANTKWPIANTIVDLSLVSRPGFQGEVKTEGKNRKEAKKNPKKPTTLISNKWTVINILLVKTSSFQSGTETLFNLLK